MTRFLMPARAADPIERSQGARVLNLQDLDAGQDRERFQRIKRILEDGDARRLLLRERSGDRRRVGLVTTIVSRGNATYGIYRAAVSLPDDSSFCTKLLMRSPPSFSRSIDVAYDRRKNPGASKPSPGVTATADVLQQRLGELTAAADAGRRQQVGDVREQIERAARLHAHESADRRSASRARHRGACDTRSASS